jgi:hypothetical protein
MYKVIALQKSEETRVPQFISDSHGRLMKLPKEFVHPSGPMSHIKAFSPKAIRAASTSLIGRYILDANRVGLVRSVESNTLGLKIVWPKQESDSQKELEYTAFNSTMALIGNDWETHRGFHSTRAQTMMDTLFRANIVYKKEAENRCSVM